ncbi:MAG: acetyl-CoA carboxylase biotin carboxyl carrier protein [Acidobacteriota bacterium]
MTGDEVLQILNLMEKSSFDFLELEVGDLKLTVSKSGYKPGASDKNPMPASQTGASAPGESTAVSRATAEERERGQPQADGEEIADTEGLVPITASMVGTFYRAPEPGAPPFVEEGGRVDEDTTVGLIEVMKVFSSVTAGVRGVISKVLVSNAQFVEYGQRLFLVRPDGSSDGE